MTSWLHHPTTPEFHALVAGELDDESAAKFADHLDDCSECRQRAADMDPINSALEAPEELHLPTDLAESIIDAIEERDRSAHMEFVVGLLFWAIGLILFFWAGNPLDLFAQSIALIGSLMKAASSPLSMAFSALPFGWPTIFAFALIFSAGLVAWRAYSSWHEEAA